MNGIIEKLQMLDAPRIAALRGAELRSWKVMSLMLPMVLSIHVVLAPAFWIIGVMELAAYNALSCLWFLGVLYYFRSRTITPAFWWALFSLQISEFALFNISTVYYIGIAPGIHFFLFAYIGYPIVLHVFSAAWSSVLFGFLSVSLFFALELYGSHHIPPYELPQQLCGALMYSNVVFSGVLLAAFGFQARKLAERAEMAAEAGQDLVRRYVPPAVATRLLSGRSAEVDVPTRKRVTVLFSDLVGFTTLSDRVEPEDVTRVINDYMAAMSEIIDQYGGTLNEYAGDGIMALFGAPEEMQPQEQALAAVRAAMAMQDRMPVLNRMWRSIGIGESLDARIGVNTGVASVGSFGSRGRMTYTAIGMQTNIAARIQSHARPRGILISEASYQLVCDVIQCEPRGEISVKGVHYPIKVHEVFQVGAA